MRLASGTHLLQVVLATELAARSADDARRAVDLTGAAAPIQGGQELAHRQVAGAAEQDEIELG